MTVGVDVDVDVAIEVLRQHELEGQLLVDGDADGRDVRIVELHAGLGRLLAPRRHEPCAELDVAEFLFTLLTSLHQFRRRLHPLAFGTISASLTRPPKRPPRVSPKTAVNVSAPGAAALLPVDARLATGSGTGRAGPAHGAFRLDHDAPPNPV